jgi:hypothetical protein
MALTYEAALDARADLSKYKHNAILLFALQVRFPWIDDIDTVATNALTDGSDDKKADLVFVSVENEIALIAQGYKANEPQPEAKSNKAADLNTAASWVISRPLEDLPTSLRAAAKELRQALTDKKIKSLQFWYVHNCGESENVAQELKTVEHTASAAIAQHFGDAGVEDIAALEIGQKTLEDWYQALSTPILVQDVFTVPVSVGGFELGGADWKAFVTAVPGKWLHEAFVAHKSKLFSANVRGYLGSTRSDANINNGIKETADSDPNHFWPFNNGLTALVHSYEPSKDGKALTIRGLSIVNGAQTTGAVGTLKKAPDDGLMVPARFVKCDDAGTVRSIIRYNNSQNRVQAADFRSNDAVQRRLREEFKRIPDVTYTGGRRGGEDELIRRPGNTLASDAAAQSLAAVHQQPSVAYHQKSEIWDSNSLYVQYFSQVTSAVHIVFCYGLLTAVDDLKLRLTEKEKGADLTETDREQLEFLRQRGANFLLVAAIAKCCEALLGKVVPNVFSLSFGEKISPKKAQEIWTPVVEALAAFSANLTPALQHGLKKADDVSNAIKDFRRMVDATKVPLKPTFDTFAKNIVIA